MTYPRWINEGRIEDPEPDMFHVALKVDTPTRLLTYASNNFMTYHAARKIIIMWISNGSSRHVVLTKPNGGTSLFTMQDTIQEKYLGCVHQG